MDLDRPPALLLFFSRGLTLALDPTLYPTLYPTLDPTLDLALGPLLFSGSLLLLSVVKRVSACGSGSGSVSRSMLGLSLTVKDQAPSHAAGHGGSDEKMWSCVAVAHKEAMELELELERKLKSLLSHAPVVLEVVGAKLFICHRKGRDEGGEDIVDDESSSGDSGDDGGGDGGDGGAIWQELVTLLAGTQCHVSLSVPHKFSQDKTNVRIVNELRTPVLVCRVLPGGALSYEYALSPLSAATLMASDATNSTNFFVCFNTFPHCSDPDVSNKVTETPLLPASLFDVLSEDLLCIFQLPTIDIRKSSNISFCLRTTGNGAVESNVRVFVERRWASASATCTVETSCLTQHRELHDDELGRQGISNESLRSPKTSSSQSSCVSDVGFSTPYYPARRSCVSSLPVTPETTRKDPHVNLYKDGDNEIESNSSRQGSFVPPSSSPVSPLLSFSALTEFDPLPKPHVSPLPLNIPVIDRVVANDHVDDLEENEMALTTLQIDSPPCVSPTTLGSPSTSVQYENVEGEEEVVEIIDEKVQIDEDDDHPNNKGVDEAKSTLPSLSQSQVPSDSAESLKTVDHEESFEQVALSATERDDTRHCTTSSDMTFSSSQSHSLASTQISATSTETPAVASSSPPRVSGVFDTLLWAVVSMVSSTTAAATETEDLGYDSSHSVSSQYSRNSSCNSLVELNTHSSPAVSG